MLQQSPETMKKRSNRVPPPEDGGRARSHAAHLGNEGHGSTKPAGPRPGVMPGALREPPQVTSRVGKDHRKQ